MCLQVNWLGVGGVKISTMSCYVTSPLQIRIVIRKCTVMSFDGIQIGWSRSSIHPQSLWRWSDSMTIIKRESELRRPFWGEFMPIQSGHIKCRLVKWWEPLKNIQIRRLFSKREGRELMEFRDWIVCWRRGKVRSVSDFKCLWRTVDDTSWSSTIERTHLALTER